VQIVLSTVLLIGGIFAAAYLTLPSKFLLVLTGAENPSDPINPVVIDAFFDRKPYHAAVCSIFGLISGMIIGIFTEYMTSHTYTPVR
jgi:inorganic pyrophosphatase